MGLLTLPSSQPAAARTSTRLTLLWHADVPTPRGDYAFALTARHLLVHTSQEVLALGVADGRTDWRHRRAGETGVGWDVAGGNVLLDQRRPRPRRGDEHRLVALSAGTGEQLWQRDGLSLPPGWRRSAAGREHAAAFLAWDAGRSTLGGISTGAGRDLWSYRPPRGCAVAGTAARAADAVVLLACGRTSRLLLLDIATGRMLTSIRLAAGRTPRFQAADGVIAVLDGEGMTLYDDSGRAVLSHEQCWPQCAMARAGSLLLTTYHSGGDDILQATSWPDGKPVWQVRPAPPYGQWLDGGVAVRAYGPGGFPVIDVIDAGTGRTTSYSVPFTASLIMAAGQRMYTGTTMRGAGQTGAVRVAALRRVPWSGGSPLFDGEDLARWPDACAFRPRGSFPPGSPQFLLAGFALPKPIACRYTRPDGLRWSARVLWVTREPEEAADMIDMFEDVYAYRPLEGVGDQAVADASPPNVITFRVGPIVASVSSDGLTSRGELAEFARNVAAGYAAADSPVAGTPRPVRPQETDLVRLPDTQVTVARTGRLPPLVTAYLQDGRPYVWRQTAYVRLGHVMEALSPDGAWAAKTEDAYLSRGRDPVTLLDTATRTVRRIGTVQAPRGVAYPVWSPDGRQLLLTASKAGTIIGFVIVDLRTMKPRFVPVEKGDGYSGAFRWGGDAATVAVQAGPADADDEDHRDVAFFDLHGRLRHRFKNVGRLLDAQNWASPAGRSFATRCPKPPGWTCVWRTTDGAPAARLPFDPEAFVSWHTENSLLGWHSLSSGGEGLMVTDLLGRAGTLVARSRGGGRPQLSVDVSTVR
nr:PQQ-binding-like beta-propeller repeat protein [Nonomuraea sp. FMUSA5-5]